MTRSYASLPQMNMPFDGAKLAILVDRRVLTLQRDDIPDIPYPGHWDLPGGGREGGETPLDCVLRETHEELGLTPAARDVMWGQFYGKGVGRTWFFACPVADASVTKLLSSVKLGSEGQRWQAMPVTIFLSHSCAVPHLQSRLAEYLDNF